LVLGHFCTMFYVKYLIANRVAPSHIIFDKTYGMKSTSLLLTIAATTRATNAFTLEMMGGRRGKGNLKRSLEPSVVGDKGVAAKNGAASLNGGLGQEITGVTMPEQGNQHN